MGLQQGLLPPNQQPGFELRCTSCLKLRPTTCLKTLSTEPYNSVDPRCASTWRDKPLTLNLLWDIAYSIHKESLHLDTLEDFKCHRGGHNAPEGEHFEYVEVQGHKENLIPQAHVHFLSRLQEPGIHPGKNFYPQTACAIQQCAPWPLVVVVMLLPHHPQSSSLWPPPPGIPHSSRTVPLSPRSNACQLSCDGSA